MGRRATHWDGVRYANHSSSSLYDLLGGVWVLFEKAQQSQQHRFRLCTHQKSKWNPICHDPITINIIMSCTISEWCSDIDSRHSPGLIPHPQHQSYNQKPLRILTLSGIQGCDREETISLEFADAQLLHRAHVHHHVMRKCGYRPLVHQSTGPLVWWSTNHSKRNIPRTESADTESVSVSIISLKPNLFRIKSHSWAQRSIPSWTGL